MQSSIMGDKQKSEIQKPVKNTLLSGASHGFPFESFRGSSMLIPVSQDSPSVLNDSIGDALSHVSDTSVADSGGRGQLTLGNLSSTDSDLKSSRAESKPSGTGYAGIFNSFFGGGGGGGSGGSQSKEELDLNSPSQSSSSEHFVEQSFSAPTVTRTFSPALQVASTLPPSESSQNHSHPIGFVHSSNSPFQQPHPGSAWSPQAYFKPSLDSSNDSLQKTEHLPPQGPDQSQYPLQETYARPENHCDSGPNIGFESFADMKSMSFAPPPPLGGMVKAQSAFDLPLEGSADPSRNFYNPAQSVRPSEPYAYQTRSSSMDSFQPPPTGIPPPPPSIVNSSTSLPSAPPPTSNVALRTYRRDLHKRPTYAPVPGLTSNTVVSSSYLTASDSFPSYSPLVQTALTSPPSKYLLSSSLSQSDMDFSGTTANFSDSSVNTLSSVSSSLTSTASTTSASSLQNFFALNYSSSSAAAAADSSLTPAASSFEAFPGSSVSAEFVNSQNFGVSGAIPSVSSSFSPLNQMSNLSLSSSSSTYPVSSVAVHPPIMSTKEQPSSPRVERSPSPSIIPASFNNLANLGQSGVIYRPVYHHWFLRLETKDGKELWQPFSMSDSLALEQALNSEILTGDTVVPTDGGRYDVNVTNRIRTAVYWEEKPQQVMRCSWFYKNTTESRLHPYDENTAYNLEEEYKKGVLTNTWNRKFDLPNGDYIIMYGPNSISLYLCAPQTPEGWEAETDFSENTSHRPKIIKRGVLDDFEIEDGECPAVDHLIFVVHGIGSYCDLKFRTVEEAVDVFRSKSLQLIKSHFKTSTENGTVNRIEILPVSWHGHLHGETTGVDKKLETITLKSIPRFRRFTNDTLLDILFYTSPVYCQTIMHQVGHVINSLYSKFLSRNPNYKGGVSLVGHSLGSLILFDMLCHQKPAVPHTKTVKKHSDTIIVNQEIQTTGEKIMPTLSHRVSYVVGSAGTGQPNIEYPQLSFQPLAFFALGSPIGMFVTVRGIESLGLDFILPTCPRFFNIFHPFDPVAYRVEALINPELAEKRPVLIPHHKGRKRMHLELKETMARVGADLKQRLIDSVRSTWNTVYQLTLFGRADDGLEQEVDKVIEKQLERQQTESAAQCLNETCYDTEFNAGELNQGRRIDYVLQEAPLESFNEYVSAIISHVIYWDSEDTMLLILKEIYGSMGISPDQSSKQMDTMGGGKGAGKEDPPPILNAPMAYDSSEPSTAAARVPLA